MCKKPRYSVIMDDETLEEVDNFRYGNRISSRAKATERLIQLGLEAYKNGAPAHCNAVKRYEALKLYFIQQDVADIADEECGMELSEKDIEKIAAKAYDRISDSDMINSARHDIILDAVKEYLKAREMEPLCIDPVVEAYKVLESYMSEKEENEAYVIETALGYLGEALS